MSLGAVTKHLFDLIAKQVEENSLVVWYDPEKHYAAVAESPQLPKTTVARYEGSILGVTSNLLGNSKIQGPTLNPKGSCGLATRFQRFIRIYSIKDRTRHQISPTSVG